MSLIARMISPISVIVTLATSFIGWKAYSDARDSVAEATRILEISTLDAVGRELTTVMNLTRQHLLTVADRIAIIELLRNPDESPEGERSKLLTRHLRRAVLDFPSIDGPAVTRQTVLCTTPFSFGMRKLEKSILWHTVCINRKRGVCSRRSVYAASPRSG